MTLHANRPQKTAMILSRRIVEDIRRNDYQIGDRLPPERVMLEDYQVGRGTLREALRFLELQNVISLKPGPGGGPTVEKPDASTLAAAMLLLLQFEGATFSSIVEARMDLEPLFARLSSQRLTEEGLAALAASVDRMRENLTDNQIFLQTNREFHDMLAWGSKNPVYGFLLDAMMGILDGTSMGVDYPLRRREAALASHTQILEAILRRDADASWEAMNEHIAQGMTYFQKKYPDVMSQTITWGM